MSQVLFRGRLRSILIVSFVMATLSVYYSNVRGYLQGFPELCAAALSLRPDFIALVETHLADESLQITCLRDTLWRLVMTETAMVGVF